MTRTNETISDVSWLSCFSCSRHMSLSYFLLLLMVSPCSLRATTRLQICLAHLLSTQVVSFFVCCYAPSPHRGLNLHLLSRTHKRTKGNITSHGKQKQTTLRQQPMASHKNSHTSHQTLQESLKATQKRAQTYMWKVVTACVTTTHHHLSPQFTTHHHP